MAEHSRSSGVFSRRRVAVNGFAAVRPPALPESLPCAELFLAGGERLRQMTPCDGWRPLPCVERRLAAPHLSCKSGRGCIAKKKLAPTAPRHPPAYAAETTTSLSPCSLSASPPKRVGASLVRHRDASREYFFANHLHCLSQHLLLLLLPDHYLPLFCNRQKWPFRLIFFCVPTICMVGAPTGHYLFLFCNCQKLPTEPNHAYFYRLAGLAPLAL